MVKSSENETQSATLEAAGSSTRGRWLGAQWTGFFLGVQSCPEPPCPPLGGAGAELGHRQGEHFDEAVVPLTISISVICPSVTNSLMAT